MPELSPNQNFSFHLSRSFITIFSLAAAALFVLLSWLIIVFFRQQSFFQLFAAGESMTKQVLSGLLLGCELAVIVAFIIVKWRWLARFRQFLERILIRVRPRTFDMALVALFAGLSEELFFRATLQPMLGIWLTSVLFVLAHLGIGRFNHAKAAFGAFVFSMSVLLGFTYEQVGLVAAFVAHASFDMVLLLMLRYFLRARDAGRQADESESGNLVGVARSGGR